MKLSYTKDAKRAAKEMRGKKKKHLFSHSDLAFIGTPVFPKVIKPDKQGLQEALANHTWSIPYCDLREINTSPLPSFSLQHG